MRFATTIAVFRPISSGLLCHLDAKSLPKERMGLSQAIRTRSENQGSLSEVLLLVVRGKPFA